MSMQDEVRKDDEEGAEPMDAAAQGGTNGAADERAFHSQTPNANARVDEFRDQYLRAVAELDNFRKRAARELEQARKFAIERFAGELVGVADALEAGIQAGADNPGSAVLQGAQATLRELHKAFEKAGISVIDPAQQAFDPNWHEAMVAQPSAQVAPGTVMQVIQKGYSINGRLLRPARVVVSKAS